jgi:hypothetical protein
MPRATAFVAHGFTRGFTACVPRSPRLRGHLTPGVLRRHVAEQCLSLGSSPLAPVSSTYPVTTTAPADASLRFDTVALSGMRRGLPGKHALLHRTTAAPTPLRLGHKSFTVFGPLALPGSAFYAVLVHRLAIYAPRFLPTLGRPRAVALHSIRCDQLMATYTSRSAPMLGAQNKKRRPAGRRS